MCRNMELILAWKSGDKVCLKSPWKVDELWPEMATRGHLINLISVFLHISSVALH